MDYQISIIYYKSINNLCQRWSNHFKINYLNNFVTSDLKVLKSLTSLVTGQRMENEKGEQ